MSQTQPEADNPLKGILAGAGTLYQNLSPEELSSRVIEIEEDGLATSVPCFQN